MIRGKEDLDIAENMVNDWPALSGTVQEVTFSKGKYKGFCLSYIAGDYLVQHEAGTSKLGGKIEGVVALKSMATLILADRIALCYPSHILRYWDSAYLIDPYRIQAFWNAGMPMHEALLQDMQRAKVEFEKHSQEIVSRLQYRSRGESIAAASGGLPTLGKRR